MVKKEIISPAVANKIMGRAKGCECENPVCDHAPGKCDGPLQDINAGPGFNGPTPARGRHEIDGRAFCGLCRERAPIYIEEQIL